MSEKEDVKRSDKKRKPEGKKYKYTQKEIMSILVKSFSEIDYVGYNYTCDNQDSLTHEPGYERQKSRALRFIEAYNYLMKNMHEIENESNSDLQFFYQEWKARLIERYNRLSEPLKKDLKADFECTLNN